jgi:pimeloyl-ACP methyl ester carboxylesterase
MIFIAHGVGGLLCAELASICSQDFLARTKGIIFLSTPFGDGEEESWETVVRSHYAFFSKDPTRALATHSTNAQRIINDFKALKVQHGNDQDDDPLRVEFLVPRIGKEDPDGNLVMVVEHDFAVLEDHDGLVVPGDQVSMTRFSDRDSRGYKVLCTRIQQLFGGTSASRSRSLVNTPGKMLNNAGKMSLALEMCPFNCTACFEEESTGGT